MPEAGPSASADTGSMNSAAVRLDSVTKSFPVAGADPVVAVRNLSLEIPRGEIVAFLGPNGAGKTTTLDMVLGLTSPTSGTVEVFGVRPSEAVNAGRIAAVLQTGGLLGDLTVEETVRMIANVYETTLSPEDAMDRAGVRAFAKRRVSKCSGGEQQRLRFALALLPEPDLLILDEPTAGMDVNARKDFWATMRAEAHEGRTIIFATHYLQEANDFAERIVLIGNGELIADGDVAEIRDRSGARLLSVIWPDADLDRVRTLPGVRAVARDADRVEIEAEDADALARFLLTETAARDLLIAAPTLDDAFTELTLTNGQER